MEGRLPWHAGVLQGAERFMTSWHKSEEEASLQRAIKRGDSGPKNSLDKAPINETGGGRKETAREESKREEADRVVRHVVDWISATCSFYLLCFSLPPRLMSRLDCLYGYSFVSVRVGAMCGLWPQVVT